MYRERGLSGAWIDLDGHFGNSIDDTIDFAPDLARAVPVRPCSRSPSSAATVGTTRTSCCAST